MKSRLQSSSVLIVVVLTVTNLLMFMLQNANASKLSLTTVPEYINYQGRLTDGAGNPITGERNMTFRLYDEASGGSALWNESLRNGDQIRYPFDGRVSS